MNAVVVEVKAISTQLDAKLGSLRTLLLDVADAIERYTERAAAMEADEPEIDVRAETTE